MNLAQLERICERLPGTKKDVKWGDDLCFLVGEKMYCVTCLDPPLAVSFKTTPEEFGELTNRVGIEPASYLARYHWVSVKDAEALTRREWEDRIRASYELVLSKLPKGLQRKIRGESPSQGPPADPE